MLVRPIFGRLC